MKKEIIDTNSLAHTKWNCKYHIVFAPKYRRKVFFEEKRMEIREILRKLCQWKGVEIIEGEVCPDHIHMLVSIPPKMSVSGFMGYLKGKSSLLIFQKWGNMKFAYRNREFWCKGYYVDTVGKNTKAIKEYIAEQLKKDKEDDQLAMFDPRAPLWVVSSQCMAGRPIQKRTCASPVSFRALPENEIPPAMRVDYYSMKDPFRRLILRNRAVSALSYCICRRNGCVPCRVKRGRPFR